ncbi:nucleobase cation symporter-1 family protein [Saccharomyces eubayanus]|uniref:nucleobase cation symporter-1 family protein n=1 Tax=Saccharomyces eubayanus TaxID=1080349 RepID=UPI0006C243A8|nr:FUI1-like protein [Saccharomyces eubayanus]KOH00800.1 FUI1-like protein [Saccharomyces eubayanus]
MALLDSDTSSKTIQNSTDTTSLTGDNERSSTERDKTANDSASIVSSSSQKRENDQESDKTSLKDNGKRPLFQRIVEFLQVDPESIEPTNENPEEPIRTFKELRKSLLSTYLYNGELRPIEAKRRTWTWKEYTFFWISEAFNINTWQISATGLQLGLNWWQTWICVWTGYTFVALFLILSSKIGNNYHISFPISSRISFGIYFSVWIVINRIIMACIWTSTLAYIGSECVQLMLKAIFGTDLNTRIKDKIPDPYLTNFEFMCFMIFWVACLPFLWLSTDSLRYVFVVKSIIAPFAAFGLLTWTLCKSKGRLALGSLSDTKLITSKSVLAWSVIEAIMSSIGNFATLILNAPDFTRFSKTYRSAVYSQFFALPFCMAIISLISIICVSATYAKYGANYWSPLNILDRYLENFTSGNRAGVFIFSLIYAFVHLGSSLSGNSTPAGIDMTALFPKFINIRRGSYICALLSLACCPWNLLASSKAFNTALTAYSFFLCSISGVIAADYFIVRKGHINVLHCYTNKLDSYYMYNKYGTNWRAVAAYFIGLVPNIPGFLGSVGVSVPSSATKVYRLNYFIGYAVGGLSYCILVHLFPINGVPEDTRLTDLKWLEHWIEVEQFDCQRELFEMCGTGGPNGFEINTKDWDKKVLNYNDSGKREK